MTLNETSSSLLLKGSPGFVEMFERAAALDWLNRPVVFVSLRGEPMQRRRLTADEADIVRKAMRGEVVE